MSIYVPTYINRVISVWMRHRKCYFKNLLANGFPPFLEPLFFLAAIGIGLGKHIDDIMGIKYSKYVASGLLASTAMFTATFELTYGTFIRMHYEKIYYAMLCTPVGVAEAFLGEILWAGTKGFMFSSAVLITITMFGLVDSFWALLTPFVGFVAGSIYGAMALIVTSYVKDINNFNFYITGCCTPMFFLSGIVLPVDELPGILKKIAVFIPLTNCVNLMRALIIGKFDQGLVFDVAWIAVCLPVLVIVSICCIRKRLII